MLATESRVSLEKLLTGAQLPALPQSAIRLLELSQNPDNGPYQFAGPIESDPGLTSQVLRFVNSSYFGFRQQIRSVKQAISLVGVRTIKNFALWSAVFRLMPNPNCGTFDLRCLWQDSLRRGLFARRFANVIGSPDFEELFVAALLQDMAVPLLVNELSTEYLRLLDDRRHNDSRLSELERECFGWTHAEAGALIAKSWHLPDSLVAMIAKHTELNDLHEMRAKPDVGLHVVQLSSMLPATCDANWLERERFLTAFEQFPNSSTEPLARLFEQIDNEFVEFAPLFKVAQPRRRLFDFLHAETASA